MNGYTVAAAAHELGISEAGVKARIARGDMAARRAGARLWLIPAEEVERWRRLGRLKPGPTPGQRRGDAHRTATGSKMQ